MKFALQLLGWCFPPLEAGRRFFKVEIVPPTPTDRKVFQLCYLGGLTWTLLYLILMWLYLYSAWTTWRLAILGLNAAFVILGISFAEVMSAIGVSSHNPNAKTYTAGRWLEKLFKVIFFCIVVSAQPIMVDFLKLGFKEVVAVIAILFFVAMWMIVPAYQIWISYILSKDD